MAKRKMTAAQKAALLKRFGGKQAKPFKQGENHHTRRRGQELQDSKKVSEMVDGVVEGRRPSDVLDDLQGDTGGELTPTYAPDTRLGDFEMYQDPHASSYRPNRHDPSFMRKTSFDAGGNYPHCHEVTLDDDGNGVTTESEGSRHDIVGSVVKPDPIDGHTHTMREIERVDVPSSHHAAGNPTSYHSTQHDHGKDQY